MIIACICCGVGEGLIIAGTVGLIGIVAKFFRHLRALCGKGCKCECHTTGKEKG